MKIIKIHKSHRNTRWVLFWKYILLFSEAVPTTYSHNFIWRKVRWYLVNYSIYFLSCRIIIVSINPRRMDRNIWNSEKTPMRDLFGIFLWKCILLSLLLKHFYLLTYKSGTTLDQHVATWYLRNHLIPSILPSYALLGSLDSWVKRN